MGIWDKNKTKPDKMLPIHDAIIYKKFEEWSGERQKRELMELKNRIERAEEPAYKKELQKEYRKRDFLRIFIVMCELARENFEEGKDEETLTDYVMDVIGSVIGDIMLETNNIQSLNEILRDLEKEESHPVEFKRCVDDRREGRVWVQDHKSVNETIERVLAGRGLKGEKMEEVPERWEMTFGDYAKYDFSMFAGVSLTEVESMLARGISRTFLHNILYGLIMRRILMDALGDDLYLTWYGDEVLFTGYSGVSHFFDGVITLEEADKEHPWLLKCISTYCNPLNAIESVDAKLGDIGVKRCILFVPMYPSENALRYSVYTYTEKKDEIIMLYLHDLYEMIEMEGNEIKEYLMERRIKWARKNIL
nr:hypothetical protein GZ9C4_26 [uncultured archaeon GZfos9C4]